MIFDTIGFVFEIHRLETGSKKFNKDYNMLKRVLIPLDDSKLVDQILKYAKEILVPKGRISLVFVIEIPEVVGIADPTPVSVDDYRQYVALAKKYLKGIILEHDNDEIIFDYSVVIGDTATVIIEYAEKFQVDAIIMTMVGHSLPSRLFLGGVTSKVIHSKICPVLVVFGKETTTVAAAVT